MNAMGAITREEALAICPDYVIFSETRYTGKQYHLISDNLINQLKQAKVGQEAITTIKMAARVTLIYVCVRVVKVQQPVMFRHGVPLVWVTDYEHGKWRVDDCTFAYFFPMGLRACLSAVDACLKGTCARRK